MYHNQVNIQTLTHVRTVDRISHLGSARYLTLILSQIYFKVILFENKHFSFKFDKKNIF